MKKALLIAAGVSLLMASAAVAGLNPLVFEVPKFSQPPVLDGNRGAQEWAGALELECSVSQIFRDGEALGWRNLEAQQSEISANQLLENEGEDASLSGTDDDAMANIWHGWDDDAFYYISENRDNIRDVDGGPGSVPEHWWIRDSMSLYVDLTYSREGEEPNYVSLNIINFIAAPMNSSDVTITWERTIEGVRAATIDPDLIEGFEYGFRDAGDEFGGEADYVIEGKLPWDTLMRFNLADTPVAGTQMGIEWILLDPDGNDAFGGQLQCWGWGGEVANYTTFIYTDNPAGPSGTAVESDSWGRIKSTFN
jgi:hypothetical protein